MNDPSQDDKTGASHATTSPEATQRWGWPNTHAAKLRQSIAFQTIRALTTRMATWVSRAVNTLLTSPHGQRIRAAIMSGRRAPYSGVTIAVGGVVAVTLLISLLESMLPAPNPGVLFLPLVAFVAYYWNLRYGIATALLSLLSIYLILIPPAFTIKTLDLVNIARLVTDTAVLVFILALARLAANRRERSEREIGRFAALTSIGLALASELDEEPLLKLIAQTACELTGASFAAFTLRPVDAQGQPLVPSRGDLFHLAAVVGVSPDQEEMFLRTPLGGEGLLAPIFRHARTVRVPDALAAMQAQPAHTASDNQHETPSQRRVSALAAAQAAARSYARGESSYRDLQSVGVPRGHPIVRSFLGAPLLDRSGNVRGGLLLGHAEPNRFTEEDERLLVGLASQAATALENARLYSAAQSHARELDVIFDSISDGISLMDLNGEVIRENRAARELRTQLATMSDGSSASIQRLVTRATSQDQQEDSGLTTEPTLQITTTENERREYLVSGAPVRGAAAPTRTRGASNSETPDSILGAVLVWRDVTEAHQLIAERRAREDADAQRELLQTIVDELPSGVYLAHGPEARLILANRAALNVWGAQWEIDQPMAEFFRANGIQALRPDGQPLAYDDLATVRSIRTGEAIQHQEEIIRQPTGAHLPVLLNTVTVNSSLLRRALHNNPQTDEARDEEHTAIVVLQDVTPLKEAERLKDEFIAIAAHELKTPMAAVKGFTEMLTRGPASELGSPLEDWQREALDAIDIATTRLVELTNDLLDVARLQADRLELRREPTDLVALTRRVSRRMQITTQRHKLIIESSEDYVVANIDPPRIEQVLNNLLSNAIKYSPEGGNVSIHISACPNKAHALISIRDSGIGIPKEQQSKLFSRFVRADNARDRSIGGTGLGLYLCREILARHGGRIWLESQLNQGSEFTVELPLIGSEDSDPDITSDEQSSEERSNEQSNPIRDQDNQGFLAPAPQP
jgi:two-component system phosphate regulon sensor histidine kinase PhoR